MRARDSGLYTIRVCSCTKRKSDPNPNTCVRSPVCIATAVTADLTQAAFDGDGDGGAAAILVAISAGVTIAMFVVVVAAGNGQSTERDWQ